MVYGLFIIGPWLLYFVTWDVRRECLINEFLIDRATIM